MKASHLSEYLGAPAPLPARCKARIRIASAAWTNGQFSCTLTQAASYALWRCTDLATQFWSQVTNAVAATNGSTVTLTDVAPPTSQAFYSVVK